MTPAAISQHETRHIFGAAAALALLKSEEYGNATVLFQMDSKGGETALLHPREKLAKEVAYLSAIAPIAKTGDPSEIRDLLRDPDNSKSRLTTAGDLSLKDHQLFNSFNGATTTPIVTTLACLELEKDLGVSRFRKLSKRLRDASNQNLVPDTGWPLTDIVPEVKVLAALKRAKALLADLMAEATPKDQKHLPAYKQVGSP